MRPEHRGDSAVGDNAARRSPARIANGGALMEPFVSGFLFALGVIAAVVVAAVIGVLVLAWLRAR